MIWKADADEFGDFMPNKHKGEKGKRIRNIFYWECYVLMMLYIDKQSSEKLMNAGFIRPYADDEPSPYDYYEYLGDEWSLGGQLTNESTILAPKEVYELGTYLPTISDLMNWLEIEGYFFTIEYNGNGYRVTAKDENEIIYKGKGGTLPLALTSIVEKLLLIKK